jgi:SAM-dependent methyltransferase
MTHTATHPTMTAETARVALVERLMQATTGALEVFTVYLGDRLGFYDTLKARGPLTAADLARATRTDERYVREWLEQQAVAGILTALLGGDEPVFMLPPGHDDVLVDRDNLDYLTPLAQLTVGAVKPLEAIVDAFRSGAGVPFEDYGKDLREGQARMNRAAFLRQLGQEWLPTVPGLAARLSGPDPARVADLGCGAGWSSIGVAQCYPRTLVDGFDLDEASVALAREHARQAGVQDRVRFDVRDAGDAALAGRYDLVMALECVHDMAQPVRALETMRRLVRRDGVVFILDERVADRFDPDAGGVEPLMYGISVLHCLPAGRADAPSAATGTVMRTGTLRAYAREAGFDDAEVLPIEHLLFRFYRLR